MTGVSTRAGGQQVSIGRVSTTTGGSSARNSASEESRHQRSDRVHPRPCTSSAATSAPKARPRPKFELRPSPPAPAPEGSWGSKLRTVSRGRECSDPEWSGNSFDLPGGNT
jgi:hypothetical protein